MYLEVVGKRHSTVMSRCAECHGALVLATGPAGSAPCPVLVAHVTLVGE